MLSQAQVTEFRENGYLKIEQFLTPEQTTTLLARSKTLLDEFDIENHPMTQFTTGGKDDKDHVGDRYFLESNDKIRYFLEPLAVNPDGSLNRPKQKAVNKIGHALHELDPNFRDVTLKNDKLKELARELQFHHDPLVLQSMVITKQQQIGGAVPEHNDSTFLVWLTSHVFDSIGNFSMKYTSPPTALGFWFALEECTPTNGALSFLPGSHHTTQITKRFIRLKEGGTGFEQLTNTESEEPAEGDYVLTPCKPGDLVIIHGSVLHKSERNASPNTRFAYTFHMIDSPPHAMYDGKNWLQPTVAMPFSRLFS